MVVAAHESALACAVAWQRRDVGRHAAADVGDRRAARTRGRGGSAEGGAEVHERLVEIAGPGTEIHKRGGMYIDIVRRGVPFRRAHEVVGGMVRQLLTEGRDFTSLSLAEWRRFSDRFVLKFQKP